MSHNLADLFLPSNQCDRQILHGLAANNCGRLSKCLIVLGLLALSWESRRRRVSLLYPSGEFLTDHFPALRHRDAGWNQVTTSLRNRNTTSAVDEGLN